MMSPSHVYDSSELRSFRMKYEPSGMLQRKPVPLVVLVGPLHVVLHVLHVVRARERPERERIARRLRRLRVVDRLVRRLQREAAAGAQQTIERQLESPTQVSPSSLPSPVPPKRSRMPAAGEGGQEVPAEPPRIRQPLVLQLPRLVPRLNHDVVADRPQHDALVRRRSPS